MNLVKKYQRGGGAGYDDYIIQSTRSKNQQVALKEAYEEARYQKFLERLAATDGIIELVPGQYMRTQKVKRPSKADYLKNSAIYETMLSKWENQQAKKAKREQSTPVISAPTQTTAQAEINKKIYNENQRQQAMQAMAQRGYGIDPFDPNGTASMQRASEMTPEVAKAVKNGIVYYIQNPYAVLDEATDFVTAGPKMMIDNAQAYNYTRDPRYIGTTAFATAMNLAPFYFEGAPTLNTTSSLGKPSSLGKIVNKGKQAVKSASQKVSQAGEHVAQKIGQTLYEGTPLETTWNQMIDAQTGKLYNNIIDYFNNRMRFNPEAQPVYMVQSDGSVVMGLPDGKIGMTQNMGLADRVADRVANRVAEKITAEKPSTSSASETTSRGTSEPKFATKRGDPIFIETEEPVQYFVDENGNRFRINKDGLFQMNGKTYKPNLNGDNVSGKILTEGNYGKYSLKSNGDGTFTVIGEDGFPLVTDKVNTQMVRKRPDGTYEVINNNGEVNPDADIIFGEDKKTPEIVRLGSKHTDPVYNVIENNGKFYLDYPTETSPVKVVTTKDLLDLGLDVSNLPLGEVETNLGNLKGKIITEDGYTPVDYGDYVNSQNSYRRPIYKLTWRDKPFTPGRWTTVRNPHGVRVRFKTDEPTYVQKTWKPWVYGTLGTLGIGTPILYNSLNKPEDPNKQIDDLNKQIDNIIKNGQNVYDSIYSKIPDDLEILDSNEYYQ